LLVVAFVIILLNLLNALLRALDDVAGGIILLIPSLPLARSRELLLLMLRQPLGAFLDQ
jgi:hypothetical protein